MRKKIRLLSFLLLVLGFYIQPALSATKLVAGSPPISPTEGAQQNAVYLPGVSGASALTIPSVSSKITGYPFTIEMWVRPNAITAYGGFFYDRNGAAGTNKTCLQFANATTGEMRFDLFGGANVVTLTSANKLAIGKWQHIAVVVTSDSALVEIDGSFYGAAHTKVFNSLGVTTSTLGLDVDVAARMFNGSIDEVRIWKSARTREQIRIYKDSILNPAAESNLIGYYNFNDGTVNDLTSNALNLTKGSAVVLSNINSDARLASISSPYGFLTPSFLPDSLTYNYYAPYSSVLTAAAINDGVTITGSPAAPTKSLPNVVISAKSKDGTATKDYTVKTTFMPVSAWDADGKTGTGSEPGYWGWNISNTTTGWGVAGGSANRFVDITTGWTYNNGTSSAAWTGRLLYIRWDGTGATNTSSIYSYPMYLEGCKTYEFALKYAWVNNGTVPTLNMTISSDRLGANPIVSTTAVVPVATKQIFYDKKIIVSPTTSGVYYFTAIAANSNATLVALSDISLIESTTPTINPSVSSLAFTNNAKSFDIKVSGNALTDTIKVKAPVGITLSKSYILASDAPCGVIVTATRNNLLVANDTITLTSGAIVKKIPFTYTKPTLSVYEQDVEVENNGTAYPLNVTSVNATVDTLNVTASAGLTLAKSLFTAADFIAGGGSVKVNVSCATPGTTGTLTFTAPGGQALDTVNVSAVAPYLRYYIKHKASSLIFGSFNTGLYPALTALAYLPTQKFIVRRTAPLSLTDTTYYILQDSAYRAVRKVSSSAWDTEFGTTSAEAKWTIQQKGAGVVTLTNVVTTKVLGTDAGAVNGRMYDDKVWAAGGNMEWVLVPVPSVKISATTIAPLLTIQGTPATAKIKIGGTSLGGNIKVALSGTGASAYMVSYDTLPPIAGIAADSTLTITYKGLELGTQTAVLTISSSMAPDVLINLSGTTKKDFTSSIVNPTIEGTSNSVVPNGWTISKGTGNSYTNTGQHYSLVTTNRYLDSWNGTAGSMIYNAQQTIKNIPNGFYTMTAAGRSSGSKAYMFANDKQTEIINNADVNGALGKGWNLISVEKVVVLDSTITIGAKTVTGWTGTWFSADDFTLQYFGAGDFASYKPVLDSLVAKAERLDLNTTPNGEDALLTTAITTAKAAADANAVQAAYTVLKKQFDINTAAVAPYAKLKALVTSATTLSNTTSYNATALATFKAAITAADGVYNAATTMSADVVAATTTLAKAQYDYKVLQPAPADFTFVLANPSFEEGTTVGVDPTSIKGTGGSYNTPNGWNAYCNLNPTTTSCNMVNINSATAMSDGNNGFETWATLGMINAFNVSQKIVVPATGYYLLSGNLRCDASSPSATDPLKFDGHIYAKVGAAAEVSSIKLAEAPGLITSGSWNTKAAWRTLSLSFKANAGDTIKLGAASTSFMQMDNFTLAYKGNNNPATIDVAYITRSKVMDAAADSVQNDPVYRMLSKDPKLNVKLFVLADVSATATFDQSPYDALIIQEAMGGGDAILMPSGALALSKLVVPTIYNKTYAFKAGRALATGATGAGAEAPVGTFAFKVDTAKWTNPLFRAIPIVGDTVQLFTKPAQDNGAVPTAVTTTMKALNYSSPIVGLEGTQLAYLKGTTSAITTLFMNDIIAPDTIGGQTIKTRMITFGMNYGAQCRDHGMNMTQANYTLWRNAVYSLVGLDIPSTPAVIPVVMNVSTTTVPAMTANVGATATNSTVKIGGYALSASIKLGLSGANASQFKLSYDSLAVVSKVAKDSLLTITYKPTDAGSHVAVLTISTLNGPSYTINLSGTSKKDMTSFIVNPGIDAASGSVQPLGWTVDKGVGNTISNTGQHYSLVTTNRYLDSWNGTAGAMIYKATQVVKNIPNGVYDMTAAGRSSGAGAFMYANDKQTEIINNADAGGTLGKGWNLITVSQVVVMDSTITIGAKTTTGWTGSWFSADDFTLTYNGPADFAGYKPILDSLIAKARRFDQTTSPDGLDVTLNGAIATAVAATDVNSALSSYTGLKKAYDANVASVTAFANLQALIASSTTLSNTTSYNAAALVTFKAAIATADGVAKAATTLSADVDAALTALNKALYTYKVLQPAPADFTFVLANPSFEEGTVLGIDPASVKKNGSFNTPKGWNVFAVIDTLAPGANFVNISGTSMADGNNGFETWVQGGYSKAITVSQKVVAPSTGYYILSAKARCDISSPSLTDPKLYDAHLFTMVGSNPERTSKKLAEMPGLVTSGAWNTKDAWRTLSMVFTANAGDTIKLGIASTSFMQMDNFTLAYRGNNNPSTLDVAYITFQKTMDVSADSVQADPVYRMLSKDTLLNVSLKVLTDVSATATFDMTPYDAMIIQESFSSTAAILKPGNALSLSKLSVPTLINKTYTFKAGGAFATGAAGAAAEAAVGTFAIKVDSINKTNDLFKGLTFVADTVQLFNAGASDLGAITAKPLTAATCKALNGSNGVIGAEGTLLAYPLGMTPAISINDILAGDTIGGQITKSRIITFNMNFGALCREHGLNMRNANYTLWRNAVYSMVGLTVPKTPMNVVTDPIVVKLDDVNGMSVVVYPNPTTSNINISNLDLNAIVKIFNMTGQQVFNGKANSEVMTVDMSRYSNGIYMLQVVSNGKSLKSKIIKK
jgi:hypothetical protein